MCNPSTLLNIVQPVGILNIMGMKGGRGLPHCESACLMRFLLQHPFSNALGDCSVIPIFVELPYSRTSNLILISMAEFNKLNRRTAFAGHE